MADLNIPNINKTSDKYLFKKKLSLSRKSKRKLLSESFFMMFLSLLLLYLNYLIPNKMEIFLKFPSSLYKSLSLIVDLLLSIFQMFLTVFIISSLIISAFLFVGSSYRIIKVIKRKSRSINYR